MATRHKKTIYRSLLFLVILLAAVSITSSLESYSRGLFSREKRFGLSRATPLTPDQREAKQEKELQDTLTLFRVKTLPELQARHKQFEQLLNMLDAGSVENAIHVIQELQQKLERTKSVVQVTKETLSVDSSKQIAAEIGRLKEFRAKVGALAATEQR